MERELKFVPKADKKGFKVLGTLKDGRKKVAEISGAYIAEGTYQDGREKNPTYCFFSVRTKNLMFNFEGTLEDCITTLKSN